MKKVITVLFVLFTVACAEDKTPTLAEVEELCNIQCNTVMETCGYEGYSPERCSAECAEFAEDVPAMTNCLIEAEALLDCALDNVESCEETSRREMCDPQRAAFYACERMNS